MRIALPMPANGFVIFEPYPLVDYFDGAEWDTLPPVGWDLSYAVGDLDAIEIVDLAMDPGNINATKALKARMQVANEPTAMFPTLMRDHPLIASTNEIWLTSQKDAASHIQGGLIIRGYESGVFYLYILILEGTGIQQASLLRLDNGVSTILYQQIIDPVPGNPNPVIKNGDIVGLQVDTYDDPAGPAFKIRHSLDLGQNWVEDIVVDSSRADLIGQPATAGIFLIGITVAPGDEFIIGGYKVISNEV